MTFKRAVILAVFTSIIAPLVVALIRKHFGI